MSEENKQPMAEETPETAPQEEPKAESAESAEKPAKGKKKKEKGYTFTREQVEQMELAVKQLDSVKDQFVRLTAEYDNYRKRTTKERETVFGDGKASAATAFLPLVDNLARGAAQDNADEGVKMMYKQALEILEKMHVKPCGAAGEAFDPNFHNAVLHVDDESLGENVIAEVLVCGYTMDDRLLRPAVVKVAN